MKTSMRLVLVAVAFVVSAPLCGHGSPVAKMVALPMYFEANVGQTDPAVRFLARGPGHSLFLTSTGAVLAVSRSSLDQGGNAPRQLQPGAGLEPAVARGFRHRPGETVEADVSYIRLGLQGANCAPAVIGLGELAGKVSYLYGSNPAQWRTNVPEHAKIEYRDVYPGIDLVFHGREQRQLEFDFVLAPGADPNQIQLRFGGADRIEIADDGDLLLSVGEKQIRQHKPRRYQTVTGRRSEVPGNYVVLPAVGSRDTPASAQGGSDTIVRFAIASYDSAAQLVIDPVLTYSSCISGSGYDGVTGIAVDGSAVPTSLPGATPRTFRIWRAAGK